MGGDYTDEATVADDGQVANVTFAQDAHDVIGRGELVNDDGGLGHDIPHGRGGVDPSEEGVEEVGLGDEADDGASRVNDGCPADASGDEEATEVREGGVRRGGGDTLDHEVPGMAFHGNGYK